MIPQGTGGIVESKSIAAVKARNIVYIRSAHQTILNDLNLLVPSGSVYGLIGPSGCGKTSFLRVLVGYKKPTSGCIQVFGLEPGSPGLGIPGPNIGYMPQDVALNSDLTIIEMLVYFGHIHGLSNGEMIKRIKSLLALLELPSGDRLIGDLSGGQQRRVSFACTVLHRPKLLILDEPTVGVDPLLREKMWSYINYLTSTFGATVIITTHYIEETRRADVVGFMRKGRILEEDNPSRIITKYNTSSLEETFACLCREDKMRKQLSIPSVHNNNNVTESNSIESFNHSSSSPSSSTWSLSSMFTNSDYWRIQKAVMNRIFLRFYKMKPAFYGSGLILFFIITIYGLFYGRTPRGLRLGLINDEKPANQSLLFLQAINPAHLNIRPYQSLDLAIESTKKGIIHGFIHIGANFSSTIRSKLVPFDDNNSYYYANGSIINRLSQQLNSSLITFHGDHTNIVLVITIFRYLLSAYREFTLKAAHQLALNPKLTDLPIQLGDIIYGPPDLVNPANDADRIEQLMNKNDDIFGVYQFILPVFTVYLVFVHSVNFSLFSLMREKLDNMFERNYAAGITTNQLLIGHFVVYFVTTGVHVVTLFLFLLYILKVPCQGSIVLACFILLLQVASGITSTFICALFSSGIGNMFIFTTGFMLACMFVGGVLWPYEALPYYMRSFRYFTPFSTSPEAFIGVMVKGLSFTHPTVYLNLVAPFIYFIITSLISFSAFSY